MIAMPHSMSDGGAFDLVVSMDLQTSKLHYVLHKINSDRRSMPDTTAILAHSFVFDG